MMKTNDKMEQHKVEKLEEQTGFEIIELEVEMLSSVIGGAQRLEPQSINQGNCGNCGC
jgi:hypothetical protein